MKNTKTLNSKYFDYAAATPMSLSVLQAMQPYFSDSFYNPSAQYLAAQAVRDAVESARKDVAALLGARPQEIIFTAGGTEANNLAIHGIMKKFPQANCVVSAIEHDSVLEPAKLYAHKFVSVDQDGKVDIAALKKCIDENTVLVSIMFANNEIGTVQPMASIKALIKDIKWQRTVAGNSLPLYVHTDACQAANYLQLLQNTLGVDLMTINGGKIYGPKQSGVLFVRTGVEIEALIYGGGQERSLRSGTENVAAIIGFTQALKETSELRESETKRLGDIQKKAILFILEKMPHVVINGALGYRLVNNLHLTIPGVDNETVMMQLDEKGYMITTGSACSASSDEPSHVLKAIGLSDKDAQSSIRITYGRQTTEDDVMSLLKTIADLTRA